MSCTDFDVRDYFLGELAEADRVRTARHLEGCPACSGSLDELHHLRFALESVPDQEPPQRIGFVSDKIFEPSRTRRMWNSFWNSGPRLGFASAALLSASLVSFSLRPAPEVRFVEKLTPVSITPAPAVDIKRLVAKAVAETEARQQKRTEALLAASERKHQQDQRAFVQTVAESFTNMQKRAMVSRASLLNYGGDAQ